MGIGTVALLKFGKVFGRERAIFFGNPRDIGSRIIDPSALGWVAFNKEDYVRLCAGL